MVIKANVQLAHAPATVQIMESPFYIPMTGQAARPRHTLKHDDSFIVLDSHGDIGASAGGPDGLFNADTRYLARLELVLNQAQPLLLGSNLRDDNSALTIDLTNPDIYDGARDPGWSPHTLPWHTLEPQRFTSDQRTAAGFINGIVLDQVAESTGLPFRSGLGPGILKASGDREVQIVAGLHIHPGVFELNVAGHLHLNRILCRQ